MKTNSASSASSASTSANAAFTNMPFQALSLAQDGSISLDTPVSSVEEISTPAIAIVAPNVVRRTQTIVKRRGRSVLFIKTASLTAASVTPPAEAAESAESSTIAAASPAKAQIVNIAYTPAVATIWQTMISNLNQHKTVFGLVKSVVEGDGRIYGVRVKFEGSEVLGFAPFSRLGVPITEVHPLLNSRQAFKVLEVNEGKGSIVLNRRQAATEEKLDRLIGELHLGQVVTGVIRNTTEFGAFVEIDGACGLLHVSNLPGGNLDAVKKGQQVTVKVIKLSKAFHRLGLDFVQ